MVVYSIQKDQSEDRYADEVDKFHNGLLSLFLLNITILYCRTEKWTGKRLREKKWGKFTITQLALVYASPHVKLHHHQHTLSDL